MFNVKFIIQFCCLNSKSHSICSSGIFVGADAFSYTGRNLSNRSQNITTRCNNERTFCLKLLQLDKPIIMGGQDIQCLFGALLCCESSCLTETNFPYIIKGPVYPNYY